MHSFHETSFLETDLSNAKFTDSDLHKTNFDRTNLERADFTEASNYTINPSNNRLKKTEFSLPYVTGLLTNLDIIIK